jgi:hypothetical protein
VLPAPNIFGMNHFVTNTASAGQKFYRLHKP